MSSRSPLSRSNSSAKRLPPLPTGGLGLDFSGLSREEEEKRLELRSPRSSKPIPSHFIPLRGSPFSSHSLPLASPSIISLSPSTPTAGGSGSYPFPYTNANHSTSTVMGKSTSTLIPPSPVSMDVNTTPKSSSSKRKLVFGKSSTSAASIRSELTAGSNQLGANGSQPVASGSGSGAGLRRKGSSSQLLMGIGKGLNRVGSVMRRNTAEGTEGAAPNPRKSREGAGGRSGRRRKTQDEAWENIDKSEADEGDAGIGRPFNVGHDLHVSPDLGDLPPAWIDSLKAQGLSESDLLLVTAARRKQHAVHRIPLGNHREGKMPKAPLSAPAPLTGFNASFRSEPSPQSSSSLTHGQSGSSSLLKKFSFERENTLRTPATVPPTKDVFDSSPIALASTSTSVSAASPQHAPKSTSRGRKTDSYPVSAAGHSEEEAHSHIQEEAQAPEQLALIPRKTKRFSDQLRGFRESTFGLGEEEDGWGQSILSAAWEGAGAYKLNLEPVRERDRESIGRIPLPSSNAEAGADDQPAASPITPPSSTSALGRDLEPLTCRSPPPPARPRHSKIKSRSHHQSISMRMAADHEREPVWEREHQRGLHHTSASSSSAAPTSSIPLNLAEPRNSSESFGVHYTAISASSASATSTSELITPCTSSEQDGGPIERVYGGDESDRGADHLDEVETGGEAGARREGTGRAPYLARTGAGMEVEMQMQMQMQLSSDRLDESLGKIIPLQPVPRKYRSNPHISLPASAAPSSATPSRCVTPDQHQGDNEGSQGGKLVNDEGKLSPPRKESRHVPHHASLDTTPHRAHPHHQTRENEANAYEHNDKRQSHSDKRATADERSSIALSFLSSRTSTSMHSMHSLHEATVKIAYKLPGRSTSETSVPALASIPSASNPASASASPSPSTSASIPALGSASACTLATTSAVRSSPGLGSATTSAAASISEQSYGLTEEESEYSASGYGCGSEETGEEARDAMNALGEAARRLRGCRAS